MAKVRLGSYTIWNAKIRYGCGLILLKILKNATTKVWLGTYIVQKAKIRYDWSSNLFKIQK